MIDAQQTPSPCFVLEVDALRKNLSVLDRFQQDAGVPLMLALKGFAMHSCFPLVRTVTDSASASSLNEARLACEVFDQVHTYAPVYRDDDFDELAALSHHLTFNSVSQFERFASRAPDCRLGLRVNPGYSDVETDRYNPCVAGSRLGVQPDVLKAGLPKGISGLHVHNLCESGAAALVKTLAAIEQHYGHLLDAITWLNLGGGHLITRHDYDIPLAIDALCAFRKRHPALQVLLEPGSAWAWRSGVLVATVLDIVDTDRLPVAMLDVSFTNHMPDTLEMPYLPDVCGSVSDARHQYRLGGCSCLAGDSVGPYGFSEPLRIGQRLVFDDMMHYTMVKTTTFNGLPLPSIGMWDKGHFELVKSFGFEDYKSRLS